MNSHKTCIIINIIFIFSKLQRKGIIDIERIKKIYEHININMIKLITVSLVR